jgi:predicted kinase
VSGGKIPPDKFSAADFYSQHNDPDATPEKIIAQFPADTAQKISAAQERLATIEQTIDQFKDGNAWQESRKRLHNEIVDRILSPAAIEGARPADGEAPTFVLLGGRGGSGKSKLAGKVYAKDRAIVLDADEIKGMLPEYEGWNAAQVHEESSFIFDHITDVAQGLRLNIVHDATMKTGHKAVALVKRFKDAGYRTEAHYMHLPRQEAAKRAVDRFLGKTQRFVPPEVVLGNTGNEASFDAVKRHVDAWSFHDNNVPMGAAPVLISAHGEPKLGLQKPDREGR